MKVFIPLVFFLLFLSSCRKENTEMVLEGDYSGIFIRSAPAIDYMPSNVTLHFSSNAWSGISGVSNYPALCQGNFTISGLTLNVVNTCMFTANFDRSLIFKGTYQIEMTGNKMHLYRNYGNGVADSYYLEKK